MHTVNFLRYIQFEKRYSSKTVIAYQNDLSQFKEFIIQEYSIQNIQSVTHQMIRSWIVSLASKSISSRTINRKISTLKSYYKFLQKEDIVHENPMVKIISPKMNKKIPEFIAKEKMDFLFDDVSFGTEFEGIRDRLIIELFYFTGMRLSELIELKHKDIDLNNQRLKVLGKRNKERIIPFSNALSSSISDYKQVREREVEQTDSTDYFFVTKKGKKIYEKLVYQVVNSYLGKVSTLRKKSPHVLRHTFATHMLNNGADLNAIKEILGHANLAATQIYTHNTVEKLKTIYKQAHPRA
ncbi:MAG: tyrosine-type recombinase/integrase [Bacteroidales bacterium]|nr:tyrosine-type recombinase/integrase [Bacteroidales bacterium]